MNYRKGDYIRFKGKNAKCIISNKDIAVFAPILYKAGVERAKYEKLFVLSNFGGRQFPKLKP